MWQGSARLTQCLTKSHHAIRIMVEVLVDGEVAATIFGKTTVDPLTGQKTAAVDGEVRVGRGQVRRECDLTVVDLSDSLGALSVRDAEDLFAPLRSEFRVWRGYQYWDVSPYEIMTNTGVEYWPVGTFFINKAHMQWPNIRLHGFDRLWGLRGRFQKPYVILAGTTNMDALDALLRSILRPAQQDIELPIASATTPAIVWEQQDDQLTRANDLALADGRVLFADPMGVIRAVEEPTIGVEVWTFQPGRFNIGANPEREIDATDAENVVIATGESDGTTPPVSGRAVDDNPASFTYIGAVPQIARFYSSPLLKTQDQCALAARTILNRELGVSDQIVVPTIPLPGLESGDTIRVVDPKIQFDGMLLADSFNIPLRADGIMSIECRTQRT